MFSNLLPGQGLGFTGSKLIAFGLAPMFSATIPPEVLPIPPGRVGVGSGEGFSLNYFDNEYSRRNDDHEIVEILTILFQVIE